MIFLTYNNNKKPVVEEKDIKDYVEQQYHKKLAYVMANDLSSFIKCGGATALSTIDKIIEMDLTDYGLSKSNRKKVRNMILEIMDKNFNIKSTNIKCTDYDDKDFIDGYNQKLRISQIIK